MERQGKRECLARVPWNRLSLPEEAAVLAAARESPEWSSRQLATWITDHLGLSVGESTVYRILRREGLVKAPVMQLLAGKELEVAFLMLGGSYEAPALLHSLACCQLSEPALHRSVGVQR